MRSESTTFYANPDGKTVRMESSAQPLRKRNADGKGFTPIDTTLVEADGAIKPKVTLGGLVLSAGRDTTLLKSQVTGAETAVDDATAKISTPSALPEPQLKGSTATYPGAYGKGRDLLVTATATGFRQQVVITERPSGPVTFKMPVALPAGLSFGKNAQGRPIIVGKDSKTLTELRPTLLQDATAADAYAPIDEGKVGKAVISLDDDGKSLVFAPDAAFLADPAVTYPVTMAAVAADWWETHTGAGGLPKQGWDTFVNNADYPDSWSNFTLNRILVGKSDGGTVRWRSYIKFPDMPDEFRGLEVQNADLILWNHLSNDCGTYVGSGITTRRVTSPWDEATMTWNSQPSATSTGQITEGAAYSPNCTSGAASWAGKEWDLVYSIDEIVQAWSDGASNYGVQLSAGNESDITNWRRYRTDEAGGCRSTPLEECKGQLHPPILTVDFELPPTPVVGALLMSPDETRPTSITELNAWAARGRVSNTLPAPAPATFEEDLAYRSSSDQDVTTSTDDLQEPLPSPEEGVTARWPFSEATGTTAADVSGNNHTATVNNGVTWTPGVSNSALTNAVVASESTTHPEAQTPQPARIAASRQAVAQKSAVEVTDETTATSVTYAQPDGKTFKTEVTAGPVRIRQSNGWVPIDTTLAEQGGKLRPKALAEGAVVELSPGGTDPFVKMTADGKSYALRWPTPLPKPAVKGAVATYTDAAGTGADLVVTALPAGFRHEVVLRQRPAKQVELRIGVEDEGLTVSQGKGGRLLLKGRDKKIVAAGTRPVVSSGGVRGRLTSVKHGKAGVDVVTKDDRTDLVVKPDQKFLADPATMYPVRVAAAVTLPLAADVDVSTYDTGSPADPGLDTLVAGTVSDGSKYRTHLRFDTTGLQGSTVTGATLSLINFDAHNCGAALSRGIQVARLTSGWDEDNLYWGTKPAFTTEDASTNFKGVNLDCEVWPDSMEWNVTGIAQDWAAGAANHGLVLKSPNETNVDNYRRFDSSEYFDPETSPPTLTVTTGGPASQPAVSAPAITPAQTVDGTTVTSSLTPQLSATVTDTAGGDLTGQFEVEHDPAAAGQGSGQIWTGTSPEVTSGEQAVVTVPAGKLVDGWKIRWRARAVNPAASVSSPWSAWQEVTVDVPDPGTQPTVGALQVNPSQLIDGKLHTASLTPSLLAQVTDPLGGTLRAEFEVEHDPAVPGQGTGQIWSGSADNVTSGTQANVTIPAGELADGWELRWRARAVVGETSSPWSDWQLIRIKLAQPSPGPLAQTAQAVINTDQSFTVAAWLRWDRDGTYTALEQRGTNQAPFQLGNDPERGLIFTFTSADAASSSVEGVFSGVKAPVNEWFHLAAVYTRDSNAATLYLDGRPIGSNTLTFTPWKSSGPLTLGTAMNGSIDEVWVYGRDLIDDEVFALMDGSPTAPLGAVGQKAPSSATALAAGRYDRISPETCWEDHGWRTRTYGLMKNRFSGCMLHSLSVFSGTVSSDSDGIDVDGDEEWAGKVMLVAKTFSGKADLDAGATTRDMWFDLYVGHSRWTGIELFPDDDVPLTIGMAPSRGQTACRDVTTFQGATQKNHLTMDVEDWIEAADKTDDGKWSKLATFRFRSDPAHALNSPEKIATCVFKPYVHMTSSFHLPLFEYGTIEEKAQIICDSARYIAERAGGCTLPVLSSIEWRMGANYDLAYKHYWKACYQSADTYPKDSAKTILGCAVDGTQRPPKSNYLWRIDDPSAKNSNARAKARCDSLWPGATWPAQECDEYPFQSSGTRNADNDSLRNFSVCSMPKTQNGEAGKALTRLYNRDRILYGQNFFNRFATKLTSVEPMKDLCFQPINQTSGFFKDQPED